MLRKKQRKRAKNQSAEEEGNQMQRQRATRC